MSKFISVGKILNFHGIQGEAKVGFSKNQQSFICDLKKVFVQINNEYKSLKINRVRLNKNFALIKFDGINSIDELLEYKGALLFVEEEDVRNSLDEDEFLIDELVGLDIVTEEGEKLGFIVGVSNNGATDLLSVKTKSQNISLIPFVKAIVVDVSLKNKKVTIRNLEGLLE